MNSTLDYSQEDFQKLLEDALHLAQQHYMRLPSMKGFNAPAQPVVADWFDEPLPEHAKPLPELWAEVQAKVMDSATGNAGRNMYAYVMSGGNQVATVAEFLMATVNQNNTKWHLAPAMTEIERRVVRWTADMIGYVPEAGGAMVSAGSEANLAGLTVARNLFFQRENIAQRGLFGQKPFTVYCSTETHNCVDKSIALLGIGTDYLRKIPVSADYTIQVEALEQQIKADIAAGLQPFCVIGNAGTVNTGAIDNFVAMAAIAERYGLWFHIDGAYGGVAAAVPSVKGRYVGLERADSVALDFHKWLYQPFEIGCFLVKSWQALRDTYFKRADYLDMAAPPQGQRFEYNEHYFQLSRNAKAFKVWLSLKAYGFARFRQAMQHDIDLAHYLAERVRQSSDFVLKSVDSLSIVCFQYQGHLTNAAAISAFNQQLVPHLEADGRVFIMGTKLAGEFVLRACVVNHRKTEADIDYLLDTIRAVAESALTTFQPVTND